MFEEDKLIQINTELTSAELSIFPVEFILNPVEMCRNHETLRSLYVSLGLLEYYRLLIISHFDVKLCIFPTHLHFYLL